MSKKAGGDQIRARMIEVKRRQEAMRNSAKTIDRADGGDQPKSIFARSLIACGWVLWCMWSVVIASVILAVIGKLLDETGVMKLLSSTETMQGMPASLTGNLAVILTAIVAIGLPICVFGFGKGRKSAPYWGVNSLGQLLGIERRIAWRDVVWVAAPLIISICGLVVLYSVGVEVVQANYSIIGVPYNLAGAIAITASVAAALSAVAISFGMVRWLVAKQFSFSIVSICFAAFIAASMFGFGMPRYVMIVMVTVVAILRMATKSNHAAYIYTAIIVAANYIILMLVNMVK